jgi:hypothetical protein
MGFIAGVEYAQPVGPGVLVTSLEHALTSPALYRRDGVDFLMFRKYFNHSATERLGYVVHLDYIGYQYGGDAQVLQWDAKYLIPNTGSVSLRIFGMRHGEMDFFTPHNSAGNNTGLVDYVGTTPSGDAIEESLVVSVAGEFHVLGAIPWMQASLSARLDWVGKRTYVKATGAYTAESSDLQLFAGFSVKL